jgi:rSAM/selenodomain-associated transferase 1
MAKAPVAGRVKTRLVPAISDDQAAFLSAAFLRDAMLAAVQVKSSARRVFIAVDDDIGIVRDLAPEGVSVERQSSAGLAAGQREAIQRLLERGPGNVVLIGSDVPTLQPREMVRAFEQLEQGCAEVVIGPAKDGGYYLIAVGNDYPDLFEGIAWSTPDVLRQTLERAASMGLRTRLLLETGDVDTINDLYRLIEQLGSSPEIEAPATRAALQALRGQGVALPETPIPWVVSRQTVHFESNWRTFVEEETVTHTGEAGGYSYVIAPDAVWIVPVTPDGRIVLIRQYRHPVREWVLEVPAGALDGLSPAGAAVKELREKIGGIASALHYCGAVYGGSGSSTHRSNYFIAFDVEMGETAHEATEVMEIMTVPAEIAFDMAARGEISDGQSALAILMARDVIRERLDFVRQ